MLYYVMFKLRKQHANWLSRLDWVVGEHNTTTKNTTKTCIYQILYEKWKLVEVVIQAVGFFSTCRQIRKNLSGSWVCWKVELVELYRQPVKKPESENWRICPPMLDRNWRPYLPPLTRLMKLSSTPRQRPHSLNGQSWRASSLLISPLHFLDPCLFPFYVVNVQLISLLRLLGIMGGVKGASSNWWTFCRKLTTASVIWRRKCILWFSATVIC